MEKAAKEEAEDEEGLEKRDRVRQGENKGIKVVKHKEEEGTNVGGEAGRRQQARKERMEMRTGRRR